MGIFVGYFFMKKIKMSKFQNIIVFEKNEKKFFFRKTGLSVEPEYPEYRQISETFSSRFFPEIKLSTSLFKKKSFLAYEDLPCPEAFVIDINQHYINIDYHFFQFHGHI